MNDFLDQLFNSSSDASQADSISVVVLNLLLTMVLAIIVAWSYKKVHRGISYSQSYAYSIVIVAMVIAFVVMVIGTNYARAFTLIGAFTLIRYRTAVKDPKDTAFIFLAIVIGLSVGSNEYTLAVTGTITITIIALALSYFNFGSMINTEQILYLTVDSKHVAQDDVETILRSIFKNMQAINVHFNQADEVLQYSYNIRINSKMSQAEAMQRLLNIEGVRSAEILSSQQVVEF